MEVTQLMPRLIVNEGTRALQFYIEALGAELLTSHVDEDGKVQNAEMQIAAGLFSVTDEDGVVNFSPTSLGGTGVILSVNLDSGVDDLAARFVAAGGSVIIPLDDRFYGRRDGRFRDPFGHLWIFGQDLDKMAASA